MVDPVPPPGGEGDCVPEGGPSEVRATVDDEVPGTVVPGSNVGAQPVGHQGHKVQAEARLPCDQEQVPRPGACKDVVGLGILPDPLVCLLVRQIEGTSEAHL